MHDLSGVVHAGLQRPHPSHTLSLDIQGAALESLIQRNLDLWSRFWDTEGQRPRAGLRIKGGKLQLVGRHQSAESLRTASAQAQVSYVFAPCWAWARGFPRALLCPAGQAS